jgi:tRNA(Arg) A34 adenosine deaminase TadA
MSMTQPADDDASSMKIALDACREGIDHGQTPFGACIVRAGKVLAVAHNCVWADTDVSAHAEIVALRRACRAAGHVHLDGATIYSTTEPCPMCFTAIHWAKIGRIVCGARIEDARRFGFNELPITNRQMKDAGRLEIELVPDVMREQAISLFELWQDRKGQAY